MYQQCTFVGRLGGPPEMRYTPSGTAVASASLAVDKNWQDKDGTWHNDTLWLRLTFWQQAAERAAQQLDKGDLVLVVGEIQAPRVYTNRAGEPAASLDLRASYFRRLNKRENPAAANGNQEYSENVEEDDEELLPF